MRMKTGEFSLSDEHSCARWNRQFSRKITVWPRKVSNPAIRIETASAIVFFCRTSNRGKQKGGKLDLLTCLTTLQDRSIRETSYTKNNNNKLENTRDRGRRRIIAWTALELPWTLAPSWLLLAQHQLDTTPLRSNSSASWCHRTLAQPQAPQRAPLSCIRWRSDRWRSFFHSKNTPATLDNVYF